MPDPATIRPCPATCCSTCTCSTRRTLTESRCGGFRSLPATPPAFTCTTAVVGSIVAGSVSFQVQGQPESVLGPRDVFYEPEGTRVTRFDTQDNGVTFLAYFLLGSGQEPAIAFPDQ
jgi:hypothetical protein